jgi:hypothetical protein
MMDYQDAVAAFFVPSPEGTVEPEIVREGRAARRLRDALEPIAMHAVWCASTNQALARECGLDFLGSYVWGRASALGDAAPGVVVSAFAVFEPTFLTAVYRDARSKVGWADLVATRTEATAGSLRQILSDTDVGAAVSTLRRGIDAADGTGRPLFSGLAGQAWPKDPYGQLWRAADILREHRGDSHVAASVAAGLDGAEMNILTELWLGMPLYSYSGTRAWPPDQLQAAAQRLQARGWLDGDVLSAEGRSVRAGLEAQTDSAQQRIADALEPDLSALLPTLAAWSSALIAAGAFPPSVHKRAAG